MALLGGLDPRQQQAEQQRTRTAQSLQAEAELAKLLTEHGQNKGQQAFTSPWQVAGQWANALAGRSKRDEIAQGQAALNSAAAPGGGSAGGGPAAPNAEAPAAAAAPAAGGGAPAGAKAAVFAPEIEQAIMEGSKAAGVNPQWMARLIRLESSGNPKAQDPHSSYHGLTQVSQAEMARVSGGQGNVWNPKDNVMAAGLIAKENAKAFEKSTGREPNGFDIYMMHQQGAAGYLRHMANPAVPAWQNMAATGEGKQKGQHWAQIAITGNQGHIGDTSGQFLQRWSDKWQALDKGDHTAFDQTPVGPFQQSPAGGQQPGAALSPGAAPAQGGAPGGGAPPTTPPSPAGGGGYGAERGQFVPDQMLKKPQTGFDLPHIQDLARKGLIDAKQAQEMYLQSQQAQQPPVVDFGGGKVTLDPRTGEQVYMPTIQYKPVKIEGVGEIQQPYWIDSKGRMQGVGGTETGAPSAPSASPGTSPGASPPTGGGSLEHAVRSGNLDELANYGEQRKVRIAGEEEDVKTQTSNRNKMFNAIYGGITGNAMNAAHQAPNLDLLKEAIPLAFTGTGADALLGLNRLAARLGIDTKGAAPRELFNTLAARILADQFAAMRNLAKEEGTDAARVFKSFLDVEEKANLTHVDSMEGAMAKVNLIDQTGKQMMRWGDLADDHVAKHGSLDPTFMKKLRKDISEFKFENILPEKGNVSGGKPEQPVTRTIGGKTYHKRDGKWFEE